MPRILQVILSSLLSLAVFITLVGLGWGMDDLSGYFANPWRVGVVVVLVAQGVYTLYRNLLPTPVTWHRLEHIGIYRLQLMATETIFVLAPFCDRRGIGLLPDAVRPWGLALLITGILLAAWALARWPNRLVPVDIINEMSPEHSIRAFPSLAERLRSTGEEFCCGPFRWLRYPHLLGRVILALGMAVVFRSWTGLVIAGLMLIVVMVRAREMDSIYLRFFGSAWASYSERTRRLVPFLY